MVVGARPRPWGRDQGLGGVAKAVRANTNPNPKAVGALPRPLGHGQGRGGVAKALGACQSSSVCGEGFGSVAKAMEVRPRPWGRG